MESINGRQVRIGINEAIDVAKMGTLVAREGASGVEQAGQIRTGKARLNRFGAGPAWYWDRRELVLCCLLVNGWATVQCCYEDTSSCSKRLVVLHLQPNLASPFSILHALQPLSARRLLSVQPPSRPAFALLEWPSIRTPICQPPRLLARWGRMGLGALAFHHH